MLNHDRRRLNNSTAVRRNVGGPPGGTTGSQDGLHRRNIKSLLDPKASTSNNAQMFAKPKSGQPASAYASIQRSNSKNDFDSSNAQPLNKQLSNNSSSSQPNNHHYTNDHKSGFRNSTSFLRDQRGKYRKLLRWNDLFTNFNKFFAYESLSKKSKN